jgi:hypothetical protein
MPGCASFCVCTVRPRSPLISCAFLICRRHFACRVRRVLRGSGVIKVFSPRRSPFAPCAVSHSVRPCAPRSPSRFGRQNIVVASVFAVTGPEQCAKRFTNRDTTTKTNSVSTSPPPHWRTYLFFCKLYLGRRHFIPGSRVTVSFVRSLFAVPKRTFWLRKLHVFFEYVGPQTSTRPTRNAHVLDGPYSFVGVQRAYLHCRVFCKSCYSGI